MNHRGRKALRTPPTRGLVTDTALWQSLFSSKTILARARKQPPSRREPKRKDHPLGHCRRRAKRGRIRHQRRIRPPHRQVDPRLGHRIVRRSGGRGGRCRELHRLPDARGGSARHTPRLRRRIRQGHLHVGQPLHEGRSRGVPRAIRRGIRDDDRASGRVQRRQQEVEGFVGPSVRCDPGICPVVFLSPGVRDYASRKGARGAVSGVR